MLMLTSLFSLTGSDSASKSAGGPRSSWLSASRFFPSRIRLNRYIRAAVIGTGCLMSLPGVAAITVTDSRGQHELQTPPKRIVALNWDLAEQLLELDVVPVGVPNIKDYGEWVVKPAMPDGVDDLGTRAEPNMEKLAALKPDLILAATPQKDLIPRLESIAPVLYYSTYSKETNSAEMAIQNYRYIAEAVGKSTLAEQKLAAMDARFAELKTQLTTAFGEPLPKVAAMRFANKTSVYIYGENSTTEYALQKLGLQTALPQPATEWGIVQKRITDLQHVGNGYVLYFEPFNDAEALKKSVLWKAMPFVRLNHVNSVPSVWNYGGAMSIRYIGEGMAQSLLEIAPK